MRVLEETVATSDFLAKLHGIVVSGDWASMDKILDELTFSPFRRKIVDVLKQRMDLAKFGM